jgi:hypothetical protein
MNSEEFERYLSSISADEVSKTPWVNNVSNISKTVEGLNKDAFSKSDTSSITSTMSELEDIHQRVMKTNYFYTQDDETKPELMARIQENMRKLKEMKTQLQTDSLPSKAVKYNDNVENAQKEYYKQQLQTIADGYNGSDNRYLLTSYPVDCTCQPLEVYRLTDSGPVKVSNTYYPDGRQEYDYIKYSSRDSLDDMVSKLKKRGFCKAFKGVQRPSDTKLTRI